MAIEGVNEEDIFRNAIRFENRDEQANYVKSACGNDNELRAAVEALLQHHYASSILDAPALESALLHEATPVAEGPGDTIGRYKLLEKIGEGGMAVVYMAQQDKPIRRKVALKIIKLGMDTKQVIARFEAERQALAMMDHPNIAKVLDAGATETGRPYFVMELVTGVSITEYCDKNNMSTKDRLALFIQVCNAVQHAHQKGIIHRDIKPSNVMVTQRDGKPVPKVIDFGIAKAINQKLTEKTLFTRYAHIIGTPAYMSPEQAELSDLDIDTRSDIYSLGVLLYELLTGTPPFSEEQLRKAGYLEMQRIILEEEPTKPSTKLSTLGETLTDVAKHRSSTPDLLRKAIRGDLDWIVMKSLDKARERRYDNASALALDVQRHLDNQPILAKAPSTIYSLRKLLRRHRSQTIAALVIFSLAVALVVVLLIWSHNQRQLNMEASLKHRIALSQASYSFSKDDLPAALVDVESILNSKHVGPEARVLHDRILARAREKVDYYTGQIEADPDDANSYLDRARCYHCLGDKDKVLRDMDKYSAILNPPKGTDAYDDWFSAVVGQEAPSGLLFGTPENLGPIVNSPSSDGGPCISSDGLSLFFHSNRGGGFGNWDLWMTKRETVQDNWSAPVNLGRQVNSSYYDGFASITADGLTLFFESEKRPGGYGKGDIWVTTRQMKEDAWSTPVNLGANVNTAYLEGTPCISPDGLSLFFESDRPGGFGRWDFWVTTRATISDPWGPPVNLGPTVNSPYLEQTPSISVDGLLLFFSSNRPGGFGSVDLWVATRTATDDPWGVPVNLGSAVNGYDGEACPHISADGSTLYFVSFGDYDLWQVPILRKAREAPTGLPEQEAKEQVH